MEGQYSVKSEVFSGPLDLLLNLVEKRKLLINEVSLSEIADDYMEYVEKMTDFPIAETANFVLVASTLVLIKSKSLLPGLNLSEEESGSIEDLERRLKLYKKYRELGEGIRNKFGKKIIFFGGMSTGDIRVFAPPQKLSISTLKNAVMGMIENLPKPKKLAEATVRKIVSLEEMIESLTTRIQEGIKMSFKNLTGKYEKMDVIVSFLAMLELVKRGVIAVRQDHNFHDIEMEHDRPGTPRY